MGLEFFDNLATDTVRAKLFEPKCGISCRRCNESSFPKLKKLPKSTGGVLLILPEPTGRQGSTGDVWCGSLHKLMTPVFQELEDMNTTFSADMIGVAFLMPCYVSGKSLSSLSMAEHQVQLDVCVKELWKTIEVCDPSIIVPMGKEVWEALFSNRLAGRMSKTKYIDLCYRMIPDQKLGKFIAPTQNPVDIMRLKNDSRLVYDGIFWERKFEKFMRKILANRYLVAIHNYENDVLVYEDEESATEILKEIEKKSTLIAFDYETTGRKLERNGADILLLGISDGIFSYAMPMFKGKSFQDILRAILTNPKIKKIAHNAKYEGRCTKAILGYDVVGWKWDTMLAARIINNKQPINLKYQTYVTFGVSGYDVMEPYLSCTADEEAKHGANGINQLRDALSNPLLRSKALQYVGEDALYTYKLFVVQNETIDVKTRNAIRFFNSSITPFVRAEYGGMHVALDKIKSTKASMEKQIVNMEKEIQEDSLVKKNWMEDKPFDYNKDDLAILLFDKMKLHGDKTEHGNWNVDSKSLEMLGLPFTDKIIEVRKLKKISTTYLDNLVRESITYKDSNDGIMRPFFNLNTVETFRSSSSSPNFQNFPKRSQVAKSAIRAPLHPPKGYLMGETDYKAMEVGAGCSIHHDKNMLRFLETGGDMHMGTSLALWMYSQDEWNALDKTYAKKLRNASKTFNFASFYGSYYKLTAPAMFWQAEHIDGAIEHLRAKGIKNFIDFEEHVKTIDDHLWRTQFPEYGQWRKEIYKFYQKHGYVETATGFKCWGPMSRNFASNAPIQGSAFHCLLWTFIHVSNELHNKKMKSFLMGQIHDSLVIAIWPPELEMVKQIVHKYGIDEIKDDPMFKWLIAPLAIEMEISAIDGNWAEMTEIGFI